ncbi:hypothetical protein [Mesorhizobium sp. 1B3]|uniref:hypothetical protein n=1 Tax=Mesorhizobium sp. 1B3 TaxID=3243599 RepID=UPI003D982934
MASSSNLDGLIKFLSRDEWEDCFQEIFDDHFREILDDGDLDFEDLAELFGDHWAMTLWGCAFEDFLTQDFDVRGGNIVDEYLKRRGWKETAQAKAYMKALRTSVMSLYEVSDVVPGKSLMARDLIRGGDPVLVSEGSATKSLRQWDRIAARIVDVGGKSVLSGGLLPYTLAASDAVFDALRETFGKKRSKKLPTLSGDELRSVAWFFSICWQADTLKRLMLPDLKNSDGDDVVFHDARFPLAAGVTQKTIATRLNEVPNLRQDNDKVWIWQSIPREPGSDSHPGELATETRPDDGEYVILGNVELKGRALHLTTNSAMRAEKGAAMITAALGDLVGVPLTEIRTIEQLMAEKPVQQRKSSHDPDMPPEIAEEIAQAYLDRHYRETLDVPVPALGNISPRNAIKSASGRKNVSQWLKYLENQSERTNGTYDFRWMWKELGIEYLRR